MTRTREVEPEAVARLKASFRGVGTRRALEIAKRTELRPTDVVLVGPRKNGNTWTEQILHGLRSRGDMNFEEISYVIPELEFAADYGYGDILRPQKFSPQLYRTHLSLSEMSRGAGKYIIIIRDPHDSAVSLYHYWADWLFDSASLSMDDLTEHFWLGKDNPEENMIPCQMQFIVDWYRYRTAKNVLWVHFEDLKEDLRGSVRRMAQFLELDWQDDSLIDLVTRQASLSFMKQHKTKFDSHHIKKSYNLAMGLKPEAGQMTAKVRRGKIGRGRHALSQRVTELIDERWRTVITAELGFRNYHEMRASINKELGRHINSPSDPYTHFPEE